MGNKQNRIQIDNIQNNTLIDSNKNNDNAENMYDVYYSLCIDILDIVPRFNKENIYFLRQRSINQAKSKAKRKVCITIYIFILLYIEYICLCIEFLFVCSLHIKNVIYAV